MKLLSHDINIIVKRVFKKQPFLAEIMINWDKIVGPKFSSKVIPLKVRNIKEKGQKIKVLHVQVDNSSIALEFAFHQQIIIERISVYLGFKAIHNIKTTIYSEKSSSLSLAKFT